MKAQGYIDQFGFSPGNGGWLIAGWIAVAPNLAAGLPKDNVVADLSGPTEVVGLAARVALLERADLEQSGVGVVCLLEGGAASGGGWTHLTLRFGRNSFRMDRVPASSFLAEGEMIRNCRPLVGRSFAGHREELAAALRVDGFVGVDTIESLPEFVRIGIDELIVCRPDAAVVIGWILAWPGDIASLSLCTMTGRFPLDPARKVWIERLDVLDSVGRDRGFEDARCGFIAYVSGVRDADGLAWLRVQTRDGRVAYATIPDRRLHGIRAIRRILDLAEPDGDDVRGAYDQVIGPACRALNSERLKTPPAVTVTRFGDSVGPVRVTFVIPLYGRVDYLEHQLAVFSGDASAQGCEIIYVLDDPPRRRATLALAASAFARFGQAFSLLTLAENRGFATASNVGLRAARGNYVCFMNSDVLPITPEFVPRLVKRLEMDPSLGIVAGILLFEDGSVQHEGMVMQASQNRGGLSFPQHSRKGWRPRVGADLERCSMITGALMLMRRSVAERLGGFDEGYVIGDFEDADICERLHSDGLGVGVDHGVRMYHLERQSQAAPNLRWRQNLTTYNAWLFGQRHPQPVIRDGTHRQH